MKKSNRKKLRISKNNDKLSPDKASVGAYSRWLETDGKRLRIVTYPKNYEADHVCYEGHSFYVVEGVIKIAFGEEIIEWQANDAFIIPNNIPHRVFNPYRIDAKVVVSDNG